MSELPLVLTVDETASVLRLGRTACYEAIRRGEIPSVRIGRSLRVPRQALEQLLNVDGQGSAEDRPQRSGRHVRQGVHWPSNKTPGEARGERKPR